MKSKKKPQQGPVLFLETNLKDDKPWYELFLQITTEPKQKSSAPKPRPYTPGELALLRAKGEQLIDQQERAFADNLPSELGFYAGLLETGTRSDRLAAYGFLVAKAPHYFITKLRDWMKWISTGMSRAESAVEALVSMSQVFSNSILPADRKLLFLEQRSGPLNLPDPLLWAWAIEDALKRAYADFLRLIERQLSCPYEQLRLRLLPIVSNLLSGQPEQEGSLLALLVNRLKDQSRKVSTAAGKSILSVVSQHPAMSDVIVSAVWNDAINGVPKENTSVSAMHSRYYGIILLTQIPLNSTLKDLANKMITMYVSLIQEMLSEDEAEGKKKKKNAKSDSPDEHNEKVLSFLLKGLHVAFMVTRDTSLPSLDILFKLTHTGSWSKSLQALWLLYNISKGHPSLEERYQRVLWESLIDHRSMGQGRPQVESYLSLLKRFLTDKLSSCSLVVAFIKRWLSRLCLESTPITCASLQVILGLIVAMARNKKPLDGLITPPGDIDNSWDPLKRDPVWCGIVSKSDKKLSCSFFEITPFLESYHPSIAILAKAIVVATKGISISQIDPGLILKNASSTPLDSFSISGFLDRWAYKTPKKNVTLVSKNTILPSSANFASLPASEIDPTDVFYHKYFANKPRPATTKSRAKDDDDDDEASSGTELDYLDDNDEVSSSDITDDDVDEDQNEDSGFEALSDPCEMSNDESPRKNALDRSNKSKTITKKRKKTKLPLLADAEDYEDLIDN